LPSQCLATKAPHFSGCSVRKQDSGAWRMNGSADEEPDRAKNNPLEV